jgi:predicted nuclease of restriction endonuclease-like (RecB) superfamily
MGHMGIARLLIPLGILPEKLSTSISERVCHDNLSKELIKNLPNVTGLSPVNIRYMERFYLLYKDKIQIFPQLVEELFSVPWGHHRYIIDKCKNVDEALFFVNEVHKNNWSREL